MKKNYLIIPLLLSSCFNNNTCEKIYTEISAEQHQIDSLFALNISREKNKIEMDVFKEEKFEGEDKTETMERRIDSLYRFSYLSLKENKTFKEKGLYGFIRNVGRTILLYNKKYEELDSLLQNNPCFISFEDKLMNKQVHFLAHKDKDYNKAKQSLLEAEKIIVKKLPKQLQENDSEGLSLFYQYVFNQYLYQDKESVHKTIDSLIKVHSELKRYEESLKEGYQDVQKYILK